MWRKSDPVAALGTTFRHEALPSGLRKQQLRPCKGSFINHTHLLLLDSGAVEIQVADTSTECEAPVAAILPPAEGMALNLSAGSSGWLLGLAPAMLSDALGTQPESQLMALSGAQLIIARDFRPEGVVPPETLVALMEQEMSSAAPGHLLATAACFRLIILAIWRQSRVEPAAPGYGSDLHTLERFRRLVEVHFRQHLSIAEYSEMLGITQSRLRRVAQRNLRRSPIQLVHMRMMREAANWLRHSGLSVKEIALALGFADSTEFSHFFKRNSGMSPKEYRDAVRANATESENVVQSFEDWP